MRRTLLLVAALGALSCGPPVVGPTDTIYVGNPGNEARVQFLIRDQGAPLLIDKAWVVASQARLVLEQDCEPNDKLTVAEPIVFALDQAGSPSNELRLPFYAEDPSFCRIGLTLTPATAELVSGGAPADLEGASVIVEARRADDDTPLRIRLALQNTLRVDTPFSLEDGQRLFLVLDSNFWFTPTQLTDAMTTDGTINVTDTENAPLVDQMQESLQTNAKLVLDANDNGILDPDEFEAPLGQGGIVVP